jgi:hypothetical protein
MSDGIWVLKFSYLLGQQWTLSGGTLSVFGGTKCLDVTNGSTTNGNKMQIYSCASGNKNQQFTTSGTTIKWANHNECLDLTDGNTSDGTVVCSSFRVLRFCYSLAYPLILSTGPNVDLHRGPQSSVESFPRRPTHYSHNNQHQYTNDKYTSPCCDVPFHPSRS